jgi:hypothetical protein
LSLHSLSVLVLHFLSVLVLHSLSAIMGHEIPPSNDSKAPDVAAVDITEMRQPQRQPGSRPTDPSPKVRTSQSPPRPLSELITGVAVVQSDPIPLLDPIDGGLAAWRVLFASILVQALPFGGFILRQCLVRFPANPSLL